MYKLSVKSWFDEPKDTIDSLGRGSDKTVNVICPYCASKRTARFSSVVSGGTYCKGCKKLEEAGKQLVGKTINGITVCEAVKPLVTKDGARISRVKCVCFCGKKFTVRTSFLKIGHTRSCGCLKRVKRFGEDNPNFNYNKSDAQRERDVKKRKTPEYRAWKKDVFDSFGRCFLCGSTKALEAHHIESFMINDEKRYDKQNGVCLCSRCHRKYHVDFLGNYKIPATKTSFSRFMEWWLCQ